MFNLLLIDDNLLNFKNILNNVLVNTPKINLSGIATNKKEVIDFLKNFKIDIIIFNSKQNNILLEELIQIISKINYIKLKNSIIVLHKPNKINKNFDSYIYEYITTSSNILGKLSNILINYYEENNNNYYRIKNIISNELKYLNFNYSYNGTRYIKYVLFELYIKKNYNYYNLQRDIYPIIAKKYNKSLNNIKSSIALAIKIMCVDCEESILKEYFYLYDGEVPKAKEVICIILDNIIIKEKAS